MCKLTVYIDEAELVFHIVYADNMNELCCRRGLLRICAVVVVFAAAARDEVRLACLILGKTPAAVLCAADDALNGTVLYRHNVESFNGKAFFGPCFHF